jgi:serine phosphatase RsbU (regulator of sigma subunit)
VEGRTRTASSVINTQPTAPGWFATTVVAVALIIGFFAISEYNYPLFHTIVELFSMVVAATVFVIAWHSRHLLDRDYLLFMGISLFFFTVLNVPHTLAYQGIELFEGFTANLPTQIFIIQRYMLSLSFVIAPVFLYRRVPIAAVIAVFSTFVTVALASVLWWRNFPDAFVPGDGLTAFKVYSEYVIITIFAAALFAVWKNRRLLTRDVVVLIGGAILAFMASEFMFSLYGDPFGLQNFIGHIFQVVAFFLLYLAVIRTALVRPYSLLYLELAQSEARYRGVAETLQTELLQLPESIPGLRIAHEYRASSDVARIGGDFYDIFEVSGDRIGVVLGDVSGKGLAAATTTAQVRSVIRAMAELDPLPTFVLGRTNDVMHRQLAEEQFVTLCYVLVHCDDGRLLIGSAGHPEPVVCGLDDCVLDDAPRNPPIGAVPGYDFLHHERYLAADENLVLYSDGISEARRGDEFFGEERVKDTLAGLQGRPLQVLVEGLIEEALRFSANGFSDDVAVLAVCLDPETGQAV